MHWHMLCLKSVGVIVVGTALKAQKVVTPSFSVGEDED